MGDSAAKALARIVLTHSTHIPGLTKLLKRVSTSPGPCSTIVPARLNKTSSSSETMELRVCVSPSYEAEKKAAPAAAKKTGGRKTPVSHRVLARKGQLVQEVFFVLTDRETPNYQQFASYLRGALKGEDCTVTVIPKDDGGGGSGGSEGDDEHDELAAVRQSYDQRETKKLLKRVEWF
jgi:hypothetical protein